MLVVMTSAPAATQAPEFAGLLVWKSRRLPRVFAAALVAVLLAKD
jgi:hypothetical protein